jgi:hypothetical protein
MTTHLRRFERIWTLPQQPSQKAEKICRVLNGGFRAVVLAPVKRPNGRIAPIHKYPIPLDGYATFDAPGCYQAAEQQMQPAIISAPGAQQLVNVPREGTSFWYSANTEESFPHHSLWLVTTTLSKT